MKLFKKIATFIVTICTLFAFVGMSVSTSAATYTKADSFGEGKFLITTTFNGITYYLPATTTTSSAPKAVAFNEVSEIGEEHLWTVTATGDNYYIQNSEGKYLYTTSTNNGVRISTTQNAWQYDATNNSFKDTKTSRYLGIYNAQDWRCYTTVNQSNYKESSTSFVFYKVDGAAPSVTVSGNGYTAVGSSIQLEATLANVTGTVVWSSSDNNVAEVDQNGLVTAKAMGKATITADANGTQGTKDVVVYPEEESTLSIAEALEVCELTGTTNAPYVYSTTGVIESIDTAYDSGYNNITVTISDGTNDIKAYRMTGGSDLKVGVTITVTGTLVNYGGNTPEFIAGCTYVGVEDDAVVSSIKEKLNKVSSHTSLAFKYTASKEQVTSQSSVTMQYTGSTTTNMSAGANNAATVGLDESLFSIVSAKNKASNEVGLNKDGTMRLYANAASQQGTSLTISTLNEQNIASIKVTFAGTVGDITVNGEAQEAEAKKSFEYTVNSASVTIQNVTSTNVQVWIASIEINLDDTGSTTTVDKYSDVEFRLRCGVDKSLADLAGEVESWGIQVTAGETTKTYDSTSQYWGSDDSCYYAIISLGDVLNNRDRLETEFTVVAYVVVDGFTYYSELTNQFTTVKAMVEDYYNNLDSLGSNKAAVEHLAIVLGIAAE